MDTLFVAIREITQKGAVMKFRFAIPSLIGYSLIAAGIWHRTQRPGDFGALVLLLGAALIILETIDSQELILLSGRIAIGCLVIITTLLQKGTWASPGDAIFGGGLVALLGAILIVVESLRLGDDL